MSFGTAIFPSLRLCTKNTSRALIERPYSCAPQAVGAVYDRPGFFVQSPVECVKVAARQPPLLDSKIVCSAGIAATLQQIHFTRGSVLSCDSGENLVQLAHSVAVGIYWLAAGSLARIIVRGFLATSRCALEIAAGSVCRNPCSADQRVSAGNAGAPAPGCFVCRRACLGSRAGVENAPSTLGRRFPDYGDCGSASGIGSFSVRLADTRITRAWDVP